MQRVRTTSAGVIRAFLKQLVAKRLIYEYSGEYRFTIPFFREWILLKM